MNCKNCGTPVRENEQFCKNCGQQLVDDINNVVKKPNVYLSIGIGLFGWFCWLLICVIINAICTITGINNIENPISRLVFRGLYPMIQVFGSIIFGIILGIVHYNKQDKKYRAINK